MPEDSKARVKNDPKEQRKRRGRQHPPTIEKKPDKDSEVKCKAPEKAEKPTYETPPPEFYKNLKRETDEILKITEEANSKYKKKEILSNWAKYEMPIESYEEIDEQENLGADYETLANTPLSLGGHFQFKHEKSWDSNTGPSPYDKYFCINMENLNIALSTIPFYERNSIDQSIFSETDIQNMNHRTMKFKQKYYNDKKYMTPEIEAQEKILQNIMKSDENKEKEAVNEKEIDFNDNNSSSNEDKETFVKSNDISNTSSFNTSNIIEKIESDQETEENKLSNYYDTIDNTNFMKPIESNNESNTKLKVKANSNVDILDNELQDDILHTDCVKQPGRKEIEEQRKLDKPKLSTKEVAKNIVKVPTEEALKNPVIESPEDLEKWLDDFLDG